MQGIEIHHVPNAYLEQIIKIACNKVAIENLFHFHYSFFKLAETFGCRAVQHHANHDQRSQPHCRRGNQCSHTRYIALFEQSLDTPMTGRRTDMNLICDFSIGKPDIVLKHAKTSYVDSIEF